MAEFKNAEEMLKNYTTHGCFVVAGERPNVMTASWGFFGEMWGKKVAVVPVRDSRFTKGIIDEKQEFTLCVPFGDKYKKELLYFGNTCWNLGHTFLFYFLTLLFFHLFYH